MAEDVIPVAPASSATAAPTVGIKCFSMIDGVLRVVDAQAVVLVDVMGRPFQLMSEETGRRIADATEALVNLIAAQNGQLPPY